MPFLMDEEQSEVFNRALTVMSDFRRVFGKSLSAGVIAEMVVALRFDLQLTDSVIQQGYDAISADGVRYQVKYRAAKTQLVLLNNFDFDVLILVNLDEDHIVCGMWRLTVEQAQAVFHLYRGKYRAAQNQVKAASERLV